LPITTNDASNYFYAVYAAHMKYRWTLTQTVVASSLLESRLSAWEILKLAKLVYFSS